MKLRNKKTGEIVEANDFNIISEYNSLAELNKEWEDYEERKYDGLHIAIMELADFIQNEPNEDKVDLEDCIKVLRKLEACQRLKHKGFRFIGKTYETDKRFGSIFYEVDKDTYSEDIIDDLDLLFGGKE